MRPRELVRAWVEAFNRADAGALAALYAPGAVNHQVALAPVEGREAIRRMFEAEFAHAEMTCIVENLFEEGEWAILEWRDPRGLRGCGFFRVVGGQIAFQRGYWDRLSFLRQQGLAAGLELRSEVGADAAAIDALHRRAFGGDAEAALVRALRAAGAARVSEVALAGGVLAGHALLSPVSLPHTLGLAPLAVLPELQRQGIGAALVRRALERAREAGARALVLVGEPAYYARFGFVPARRFGLSCQWPGTEEAFQALELAPNGLAGQGGRVDYHPVFDALA